MRKTIPRAHPLSKLFTALVERSFCEYLGLYDPYITFYISNLLIEFTHVDNLYKIRDSRGKRLEDIGEMLAESDLTSRAESLEREREVRKHIGDYTLFFTGMFPESLRKRAGVIWIDHFREYINVGKESYRIVAQFDCGEYKKEALLFRKLADNFDVCVVGLNFVKKELEKMQQPDYLRVKRIIY
ncbi:MAG TPA: hypothetical protein ENL39_02825 [Candidatus Aerophobetes bacterium]|uniref:Uncharacterized protein n=1 Tax=Aerophobetes bacterium TaxID=2030807 RepID=A0A7V5HYR5_UNCAE|nr:hypothetical protein [Candidatus Aerophobetes bacterium]